MAKPAKESRTMTAMVWAITWPAPWTSLLVLMAHLGQTLRECAATISITWFDTIDTCL